MCHRFTILSGRPEAVHLWKDLRCFQVMNDERDGDYGLKHPS